MKPETKKPLLSVMLLQGLMVTESGDNPYRRSHPVWWR